MYGDYGLTGETVKRAQVSMPVGFETSNRISVGVSSVYGSTLAQFKLRNCNLRVQHLPALEPAMASTKQIQLCRHL